MDKPKEETSKNIAVNLDFKLPKGMCGGMVMGGSLEELKEAMEIINPPKEESKDNNKFYVIEGFDEIILYKNYDNALKDYKEILEGCMKNNMYLCAQHRQEIDGRVVWWRANLKNEFDNTEESISLYPIETEN